MPPPPPTPHPPEFENFSLISRVAYDILHLLSLAAVTATAKWESNHSEELENRKGKKKPQDRPFESQFLAVSIFLSVGQGPMSLFAYAALKVSAHTLLQHQCRTRESQHSIQAHKNVT